MRRSLIIAAGAASMLSSIARADAPLTPTEKWVVNFDDAQCVASRNYGTPQKPLYLVLKAPPLGKVMQIAVMRAATGGADEQRDARLTIDERPPLDVSLLVYTSKSTQRRVNMVNLTIDQFAPMRQAHSLAIASKGLHERFALTSMDGLLKLIDSCVADLVKVWNVNEGLGPTRTLSSRAMGNVASFFSSDDYPRDALYGDNEGKVRFVILVKEDGTVADCTLTETSGAAALDAQTCAVILKRAKFTPAVGLDGKPAKDALSGTLRWKL